MGYYTNYELSYDGELDPETLLKDLDEISGYTWYRDYTLQDVKWYEHCDHMKIISKKYPDVLFTLHGVGEENGDIWKRYYKNGKDQYSLGRIVFDEFDESKLGD